MAASFFTARRRRRIISKSSFRLVVVVAVPRGYGGGAPGFGSSSPKRLVYLGLHVEAASQVALAEFAQHCQLVSGAGTKSPLADDFTGLSECRRQHWMIPF